MHGITLACINAFGFSILLIRIPFSVVIVIIALRASVAVLLSILILPMVHAVLAESVSLPLLRGTVKLVASSVIPLVHVLDA